MAEPVRLDALDTSLNAAGAIFFRRGQTNYIEACCTAGKGELGLDRDQLNQREAGGPARTPLADPVVCLELGPAAPDRLPPVAMRLSLAEVWARLRTVLPLPVRDMAAALAWVAYQ